VVRPQHVVRQGALESGTACSFNAACLVRCRAASVVVAEYRPGIVPVEVVRRALVCVAATLLRTAPVQVEVRTMRSLASEMLSMRTRDHTSGAVITPARLLAVAARCQVIVGALPPMAQLCRWICPEDVVFRAFVSCTCTGLGTTPLVVRVFASGILAQQLVLVGTVRVARRALEGAAHPLLLAAGLSVPLQAKGALAQAVGGVRPLHFSLRALHLVTSRPWMAALVAVED